MHHKAHWEKKTDNLITKNMLKNRVNEMRNYNDHLLEQRRARLAALLEAEEKQYEQEFLANLETPEQVRQKMAERLMELKEKREQERQQLVEAKQTKRFRDTADELRKEDSKFYTNQAQLEREAQMHEKKAKLDQERMEEMLYSELWKMDMLKKQEREMKEKEQKQKLIKDTHQVLDWQKATREQMKMQDNQLSQHERNMLNQQWKVEADHEKMLEQQKLVLNKERNLELIRHNEMEKKLRSEQELREKMRDKELLQQTLDRESAIKKAEDDEKDRRRQEAKELQKHYFTLQED